MYMQSQRKRVVIVGGGFGGVRAALDLARQKSPDVQITLISDKHHFEYTPALYKLATGHSPMETCIPLREVFDSYDVEILIDTIAGGSVVDKILVGESGSRYQYDYLVLALGSETSYFNVPGIQEHAYSMKSVAEALKLKRHLHELFNVPLDMSKRDIIAQFQFVIVGGGPSGVELAGEIRRYGRKLAKAHRISPNLITVDILQSAPRLLPTMPESVSHRVMHRLTDLGVNILLNHAVSSEDAKGVYLKDIELNAKTIVWTAGVRASHVYGTIAGLTLDKGGRILVDEDIRAKGTTDVFVVGDSAATPFAGTAQTAIYDGGYVARAIASLMQEKTISEYKARKTPYVVPIGPGWAVFTYKNITLSGWVFWWLREFIDLRFFLSILPLRKAFTVWREGGVLCESCPTCDEAQKSAS